MSRKPVVLINDTRVDRHHGCDRVIRTIFEQLCLRNFEVVAASPSHRDWRRDIRVMRALETCCLVVVNGEGTIHHDSSFGRNILEVGAVARTLGIPAALINMSWEANSAQLISMLNDFTIVSVREFGSQRELAAAGVVARRVPDLSLFETIPPSRFRNGVAVTDSVLPDVARRLDALRGEIGAGALSIFHLNRSALDYLRLVRLASQVRRARGKTALPTALFEARRLAKSMVRTEVEFVHRVSQLSLLVTGRFHAVCVALSAGTPFLAVESNTHKIGSLIGDAGVGLWRTVPTTAIDAALVERASAWEPEECAGLEAFLAETRARISTLFDDLQALT